jgi:predicted porin
VENKLLSSVKAAGVVGTCVFSLSQAAVAANVQISGQIDTYIESYTAGDQNTVRLSSGGGAGGSRVTFSATEKINGPTEAFMRLEMGVLTDQGTSSGTPDVNWIFERETVVGVRGEFA